LYIAIHQIETKEYKNRVMKESKKEELIKKKRLGSDMNRG
jgi:hypothetical protein